MHSHATTKSQDYETKECFHFLYFSQGIYNKREVTKQAKVCVIKRTMKLECLNTYIKIGLNKPVPDII